MNISTTSDDIKTTYHILSRLNILPRYTYNTIDKIPITDGVFIGFEEGEKYQDMDRIVYVGCNNSSEKLSEVIERQFSGSKNEVPLRKHIGTALLISKRDSYYRIWQKDSSDPVSLRRIGTFYDANKEERIEGEVSAYMRKHMSFSCIPVSKINLRKSLQKNLLSSLQKLITNSPASNCWLGRFKSKIQGFGTVIFLKMNI